MFLLPEEMNLRADRAGEVLRRQRRGWRKMTDIVEGASRLRENEADRVTSQKCMHGEYIYRYNYTSACNNVTCMKR